MTSNNPRINGLYEIPNVLSTEDADKLSNAIDNQHYGEWCPEGFDRRNRVQRYSGKEMEDHFGWVFDKVIGARGDQPSTTLRRPLELVITEHTPSSCRSIVNTFEQRELCHCRQQQQQQCHCYVAQLTLVNNAIYSIEKPVGRDLECWDLAEPATDILMEQNGVVIKMGESLWEWRGRISDIKDANSSDNEENKGWKKGQQKLKASNKRCVTLSFRAILPPEPSSLLEEMTSCSLTEGTKPQLPR